MTDNIFEGFGVSQEQFDKISTDLGFVHMVGKVVPCEVKFTNLIGSDWVLSGAYLPNHNAVKAVSFSLDPSVNKYVVNWVIHIPKLVGYRTPTPCPVRNHIDEYGNGMIVFFKNSDRPNDISIATSEAIFGS